MPYALTKKKIHWDKNLKNHVQNLCEIKLYNSGQINEGRTKYIEAYSMLMEKEMIL